MYWNEKVRAAVFIQKLLKEHKIDLSKFPVDDSGFMWVFHEESGRWISSTGESSMWSPDERKKRAEEVEQKQLEKEKELESWSRIRQKILDRDDNTCQVCLKKLQKLDIHHIIPRVIPESTNHYDNLIAVCHSCHQKVEQREILKKDRPKRKEGEWEKKLKERRNSLPAFPPDDNDEGW